MARHSVPDCGNSCARLSITVRSRGEHRATGLFLFLLILTAVGNLQAAAPVIDSFHATPAVVAPGETVTLEVAAHDPDCASECFGGCGLYVRSDLTVWSANGGAFVSEDNGISGSPFAATAEWQAPSSEDSYTLTVSLADSGGMLCGGRQSTSANVVVQVTSTPNSAPVIESLDAQPVALYPGESSHLMCTAADPDDDPVSISWSTDLGEIVPGVNGSATVTSESPGLATVTCTASDPSGAASAQSIVLTISDVEAERIIRPGIASPHRLDVDSQGVLYVVDRRSGGIAAIRLETGALMYRIPMANASAVAADWQDRLLVGTSSGAGVFDRAGNPVFDLATGLGEVSDVAVDRANRRFVSLYRKAGRVVVHDETGAVISAFGTTGEEPAQLMGPNGVGVTPTGHIVVADTGHGQIKEFDLDGNLVQTIGQAGGAVGEFVELDDVAVDQDGQIYASDSFQDWIQTFRPDGSLREVIGSYGEGVGEFKTAAGIVPASAFGKLVVASVNTPGIQVFQLGSPTPVDWPAPQIGLSASALTFSDQEVGSVGGPLEVIVTNNGNAPLGIHDVAVAGPFATENTCRVIDPGQWCSFPLVFAPKVPGQVLGSLSFLSNAGAGEHTVALSGTGFVPANLMLSATVLEFAHQGIGTTSPAQHVVLSNIGTVPLAISGIESTVPFGLSSTCSSQLAGGASCTLGIEFAPDTTGPAMGAVTIDSSATESPSRIDLSGEGVLLELTPDPGV
ncbi:MAG: choice-of-anchor D domain-containing protein, partial [Acidobacteriota bacterium]